jgi:hypothetical protein
MPNVRSTSEKRSPPSTASEPTAAPATTRSSSSASLSTRSRRASRCSTVNTRRILALHVIERGGSDFPAPDFEKEVQTQFLRTRIRPRGGGEPKGHLIRRLRYSMRPVSLPGSDRYGTTGSPRIAPRRGVLAQEAVSEIVGVEPEQVATISNEQPGSDGVSAAPKPSHIDLGRSFRHAAQHRVSHATARGEARTHRVAQRPRGRSTDPRLDAPAAPEHVHQYSN